MTAYEAIGEQRRIERNIRRWKREQGALRGAGLPTEEASRKIKSWQDRERDFLRQTGMKRQGQRSQVGGYGKSEARRTSIEAKKKDTDFGNTKGMAIARGEKNGIIKESNTKADTGMFGHVDIGKINRDPLEKTFGKILTDEIIVTNERIAHIKSHHPDDFILFERHGRDAIRDSDIIMKDGKNEGTGFFVNRLEETNLNVVVRVVLETDNPKYKNSVMTFYRIRDKNLINL